MFRDFDQDGSPDLYVCNDFNSPDRFWLNNGRGQFRAAPPLALRQAALASMAVDAADINRDGHDDFIVTEMLSRQHQRRLVQRNMLRTDKAQAAQIEERPQSPRNMLFLSRGDGSYAEIACYAGLEASEWSWSPLWIDVDLDGHEDLLVVNGFERDNMNIDAQNRINQAKAGKKILSKDELTLRRMFPRLATGNLAFRNRGDLRFEEVSHQWGFDVPVISQGACLADLDNDGDLDVVVNNMNDAAGLYRNDASAPRLAVRLKGQGANRQGIGARLRLSGGPAPQSQEMMGGGRYLSSDQALRVFAAGALTNRLRLEVTWRSGRQSIVSNALPNCLYEVEEAQAYSPAPAVASPSAAPAPLFEDQSQRLNHRHQEEPFEDFARQPLLPKRLSQLGPGVGWWDLDGDGWEDLFIGSGKGGRGAWYQNDRQGGWKAFPAGSAGPVGRDQAGVAGWKKGAVLVASANYEDGQASGPAVQVYSGGPAQVTEAAPAWEASAGPLALADYDGDGQLDLLVGGRVQAGQYPARARSRLYRGQGQGWVLDQANSGVVGEAGLVSGAVWSDLDGDGWPELVLACEWGPVRVYENKRGQLREVTGELGLGERTGWWNGVSTGDLDGDGQLDIIATNWGLNTPYEASPSFPLWIYYGDFNGDGILDVVEACREDSQVVPIRDLHALSAGLGFVRERFPTHAEFARATLPILLGETYKSARHVEATTLYSTVFFNRTKRFEARPLPREAQFSTAFAVCPGDMDGDGHEDLFLSQNFFATESKTPRCDAGRGLWLRGDGRGGLSPVPGQESGVTIYGEQRGAALCDYDHDGRIDLVVSQNGAHTRLFRNTGAKPGLRIRLDGPSGNPLGIGAVLRLESQGRLGPAREIHAGSGYWSQEGAVQVMASPVPPTKLHVRWPGGKTTVTEVAPGTKELVVNYGARP